MLAEFESAPLQNEIDTLAEWLASHWTQGFEHSYSIAHTHHRAWKYWRLHHPESHDLWWCRSLREAATHYSWVEDYGRFDALGKELRVQLREGDDLAVARTCREIFAWGGVARSAQDHSRIWIDKWHARGELARQITLAVSLLQPDCMAPLQIFDGHHLLMNSALTKIYAAADETNQIVMYDGRVGAALGLLVRKMLEQTKRTDVPDALAFRWGAAASAKAALERTRDPSRPPYSFLKLPHTSSAKGADQTRAELTRKTNILCRKVCGNLAARGIAIEAIELERALFMLGYDVRENAGGSESVRRLQSVKT